MSALLMGRAFYAPLDMGRKLTLLALADHADDDGRNVFVGQIRLAQKVGCSERTIRRIVLALVHDGYLIPDVRVGSHGTNRYALVVERLPLVDRTSAGRPAKLADRPPVTARDNVDRTELCPIVDRTELCPPNHQYQPSGKEKAVARRTRLPADFGLTPEREATARRLGCRTPQPLLEAFRDYWHGTGKPMADWERTFATWARRAHGGPPNLACPCGGRPRAATKRAREGAQAPARAIPDEKPTRSRGEVARVAEIVDSLPFMRKLRG